MSPVSKKSSALAMQISRYVKILEDGSGQTLVYHSLFGNIHIIPASVLKLFKKYEKRFHFDETVKDSIESETDQKIFEKLVSLYFIVPENFDEREVTRNELKRRFDKLETGELINAVQLNVSEGCNLKCTYCFADRVDERSSMTNFNARNDTRIMSWETALESIRSVKKIIAGNGNNNLVIKFFGREPMLNWKVIEKVIDYCQEDYKDFQYLFTITTNGTLFNSENVRKLSQVKTAIVVSLDGFAKSNKLRITNAGRDTFADVDKGLSILKEEGVSSCVATVLTDWNFDTLGREFLDYLENKLVSQWEIKIGMQNAGMLRRSPEQYADKLFELYKLGKEKGILVTGDWYDPFTTLFHTTKLTTDKSINRLAPNSCSATDHQISIEPSGKVFGCRALDTQLGDSLNIEYLLQSYSYKNLAMRTYYNIPFCHGCKLEGFCQGVCLGHSEKLFGDIYQPDNAYCEIYRKVFDLLLEDFLRSECL